MATLSYKQASILGVVAAPAAVGASGDKVNVHDHGAVLIHNDSASSITVTVAYPGNNKYGQANPDIPVTVAAGVTKLIGPFPHDLGDSADSNLVALSYSATADVFITPLAI